MIDFESREAEWIKHTDFADPKSAHDGILKLRVDLQRSNTENAQWRKDVEGAAGELLVPIPQPGTDAAKMLLANRAMVRRISKLESALMTLVMEEGDDLAESLMEDVNDKASWAEALEEHREQINEARAVLRGES